MSSHPLAKIQNAAVGMGLLGGLLVIVGATLPWLETGGVKRSVFTLARVANELGLLNETHKKLPVYALLAMPFLAPTTLILWSLQLRVATYFVLLIIALIGTLSGAAGVIFSSGLLGPLVTLIGGVFALTGTVSAAILHLRSGRSETTPTLI
jgi:hypothetical protein